MDILDCARVAVLLKDELDRRSLRSFAKVSGSKGMQVYVPLNTRVTYDQSRPFAHELARKLEQEHRDLAVSVMAKNRREGRVFIDWGQNSISRRRLPSTRFGRHVVIHLCRCP